MPQVEGVVALVGSTTTGSSGVVVVVSLALLSTALATSGGQEAGIAALVDWL